MGIDDVILVVKKDILFGRDYFEGFKYNSSLNFESRIMNNREWIIRKDAEKNPNYKQPIAYIFVINPKLNKIYAYQRANKDKYYQEKRLQGKWSWGVGGHIEKKDFDKDDAILASMLRELNEEININSKIINARVLGYINNDNDSVGKVHFGILYLIETDAKIIKPKDPEIAQGGLKSLVELEKICSDSNCVVEEWSKIALNPLKKILG